MANLKNEHIPTAEQRELVFELASQGKPQYEIAKHVGIALHTLRKHYRQELDDAAPIANERVKQTAYQLATSGESPAMTMFWLKCRDNWRETQKIEITGDTEAMLAGLAENLRQAGVSDEVAKVVIANAMRSLSRS